MDSYAKTQLIKLINNNADPIGDAFDKFFQSVVIEYLKTILDPDIYNLKGIYYMLNDIDIDYIFEDTVLFIQHKIDELLSNELEINIMKK